MVTVKAPELNIKTRSNDNNCVQNLRSGGRVEEQFHTGPTKIDSRSKNGEAESLRINCKKKEAITVMVFRICDRVEALNNNVPTAQLKLTPVLGMAKVKAPN